MDASYRILEREGDVPYHVHLRRGWEPEVGEAHGPLPVNEVPCADCGRVIGSSIQGFSDCHHCSSCADWDYDTLIALGYDSWHGVVGHTLDGVSLRRDKTHAPCRKCYGPPHAHAKILK